MRGDINAFATIFQWDGLWTTGNIPSVYLSERRARNTPCRGNLPRERATRLEYYRHNAPVYNTESRGVQTGNGNLWFRWCHECDKLTPRTGYEDWYSTILYPQVTAFRIPHPWPQAFQGNRPMIALVNSLSSNFSFLLIFWLIVGLTFMINDTRLKSSQFPYYPFLLTFPHRFQNFCTGKLNTVQINRVFWWKQCLRTQ